MPSIQDVPRDVLHRILSFLSAPDLERAALVSKNWILEARDDDLWKRLALKRFPTETVCVHPHCAFPGRESPYSTFRELLYDDNRANASVKLPIACTGAQRSSVWSHSVSTRLHYECQVLGLEWQRWSNALVVYVEARGEQDLRRARLSTIACVPDDTEQTVLALVAPKVALQVEGSTTTRCVAALVYDLAQLCDDNKLFSFRYSLEFFYACPPPWVRGNPRRLFEYQSVDFLTDRCDYPSVPLLARAWDESLADSERGQEFCVPLADLRRLVDESPEEARSRWSHIPQRLLDRGWYVEDHLSEPDWQAWGKEL